MNTGTYASTIDQWARSLVSLSKAKPCQFSSVTAPAYNICPRFKIIYKISVMTCCV